ncbi:MAG: hypothetical protein Q9162_003622 [Coniocarpon cinnabarinum]
MTAWKSWAYVLLFTAIHPATLIGLHLTGHDLRTLSLTYLSLSTLFYVWFLVNVTYPFFTSPFRHLPEPPDPSFFFGHGLSMVNRPLGEQLASWMRTIPNDGLIHFRGFFHRRSVLLLTTPDNIAEVLIGKPYDWVKPRPVRRFLSRITGNGLVVVEGPEHKIQRKSVAAAFSGRNIRDLVPSFWSKSQHFADVIASQMQLESTADTGLRTGTIEVGQNVQRITLDIIGKVALGKDMDTLVDSDDELAREYAVVLDPEKGNLTAYFAMNTFLPQWLVRRLPGELNRTINNAATQLRLICRRLVAEKKAAMQEKNVDEKNILSILLRGGQLADEDIVNQLLTFLAAGHETTSGATLWATYLLSLHQDVQSRLRQEVKAVMAASGMGKGEMKAETLDGMPYLHAVCSETVRMYPLVPVTAREAIRTTSIGGQVVPKGTNVAICGWGVNKAKPLWGEDAEEFKPERWMPGTGDPSTGGANSRYSYLSFIHGPRSCIGQGFAMTELKCLIAGMLLRFHWDFANPAERTAFKEPVGMITIKPQHGVHVRLTELDT